MAASIVPRRLAKSGIGTLAALLGLAVVAGGALLLGRSVPQEEFIEYRMAEPQDAPIAIATGSDGSIWFTIDHADAIGRVRDGRIERLPTSSRNVEPLGLAVAADGSAWYTDLAQRAIARISSGGEIARFTLDTPIARLGRLAIAPDGAAWFADQTGYGLTRLKDGVFSRHRIESARGGPYGVAVTANGAVWGDVWFGMLRRASLGRLRGGDLAVFALPRDTARPFSVAVDHHGNVWYADISGFVGMLPASRAGAR
jgi:virginiamycin B lyase